MLANTAYNTEFEIGEIKAVDHGVSSDLID